jgi:histidine triad (HIT) family protein
MTLFEKIANHEIPATILYEDEEVVAFRDISPQAPQHIIIIPRRPISSINDVTPSDAELVGRLVLVAKQIAATHGVADSGYRLVFNCGKDAGQSVDHIHLHLLGGRELNWPPG